MISLGTDKNDVDLSDKFYYDYKKHGQNGSDKMSYTEQMENALCQEWDEFDDYDEDYKALIEVINSEHYFRSFGDGLLDIIKK
ncbi:MAG: hypothetical protein ACI4GB_08965 [Acutalibacteraceae bacterium]